MTKLNGLAMLGLAAIAAAVSTCGGVTDSRETARDKATKATCDRYQTCGLIGTDTGDAYPTYDSCSTIWKSNWEQSWPVATCASINQSMLNACLSAIGGTTCDSFLDFLATLGKCQATDICVGASTADGG